MKKYILLLLCLTAVLTIYPAGIPEYFADKTLRADYIFSGDASQQDICLDRSVLSPHMGGKKTSSGGTSITRQRTDCHARCSQWKDYLYNFLFLALSGMAGNR